MTGASPPDSDGGLFLGRGGNTGTLPKSHRGPVEASPEARLATTVFCFCWFAELALAFGCGSAIRVANMPNPPWAAQVGQEGNPDRQDDIARARGETDRRP